jgi:GDPmannose 4,6-dehydratase
MKALITGVTGQDGSYLAEQLLKKGYEVHAIMRRCAHPSTVRIEHILHKITIHHGDLTDQGSLNKVVTEVAPDEIYNLGAQTFVGASWDEPILTAEVTGLGALRMLEAMRYHAPEARFYQASSSEMYGNAESGTQSERTPFAPRSPYGVAKLFAHQIAVNYRESYGLHVSCGILFNHESPRRGLEFVTRKIARQVAEVALELRDEISLGNTSAFRDWGYAPDYTDAMWRMLQQDSPDDYVIATGETHSVAEFLQAAMSEANVSVSNYHTDPSALRPAELHSLCGDISKAKLNLGWQPSVTFDGLVKIMVQAELDNIRRSAF